jgi:hypothetical protein
VGESQTDGGVHLALEPQEGGLVADQANLPVVRPRMLIEVMPLIRPEPTTRKEILEHVVGRQELRHLLEEGVARHLVEDVPNGVEFG